MDQILVQHVLRRLENEVEHVRLLLGVPRNHHHVLKDAWPVLFDRYVEPSALQQLREAAQNLGKAIVVSFEAPLETVAFRGSGQESDRIQSLKNKYISSCVRNTFSTFSNVTK